MRASALTFVAAALAPLAVLASAPSCTVEELDLTGKQCPCAGGYVCDKASNTCLRTLQATSDGGPPNIGEGGADAQDGSAALLKVTSVTTPWQAPNMARLDWTVAGSATDFLAYSVVVSEQRADFDNGTAKVLGKIDHPELELFDSRGKKTSAPEIWTLLKLRADTPLFVQVEVKDKGGLQNRSGIVEVKAPAGATVSKAIFDGTLDPAVKPFPSAAAFDYRQNTSSYLFTTTCSPPELFCFREAELRDVPLDLTGITAPDFARAFLDITLDGGSAQSSIDTSAAIQVGRNCTNLPTCRYGFKGWTQSTAPGASRTKLQVPLSALVNAAGTPLTHALLDQQGFKIAALAFSGTWKDAALFRLYSAHIRW